ncbi:MAG: helix-turn-helix transcriptional regulator [Candidatus Izemoplasmatales bacterium]|nr:helix-turn-helix transcriptional regulator [Candidatus Izemoplasmatales bacterium]
MSKVDIESLKVELRRGTQILMVLSQLNNKEYGYSLLEKLIDKDLSIEAGTLYPLMRRLESQGLLESEWDTTSTRPRKYYEISDFGKEVLDELLKEWEKINEEIMKIVGETNE